MKIKMVQSISGLQGSFKNGHEYDVDNADEFIRHGWGVAIDSTPAPVEVPAPTPAKKTKKAKTEAA